MLAGAAFGQERLKPWEIAAMTAVKAINSGNADLYLASAHPAELYRLKEKFVTQVLVPRPGVDLGEQLKPYGVTSVEQLLRMPDAAFAAVAIPQQYAANDAATKEAMGKATFEVKRSVVVEDGVYEVHIALHVPFPGQPLDQTLVALVVRDEAGRWKYGGLR